ncbi:MAG: DUF1552 domain-containing protein [Deltaproteobacteria bacterium]|nr:DUF1552 domain-containing protein [Deltaproteobacteria bacterium]
MTTTNRSAPRANRRQVLRGAGGFALSLPFLPSLLPRAMAAPVRTPRFFLMATEHGGIKNENMFPSDASLTDKSELRPGHQVSYGKIKVSTQGNDAVVSEVLRAPASKLNQRIVDRMNVMRGLSVPFDLGHNTGGALGNYNRTNKEPANLPRLYIPTIDQVMAWSSSFYPNAGAIRQRSMLVGEGNGYSYNYANPATRTGEAQAQAIERDARVMFDKAIGQPMAGPAPRKPVVDKVIEEYRSLRTSNRRLSPGDKVTLDAYMQRLSEIESRLGQRVDCGSATRPGVGQDSDPRKYFSTLNDVIAAAFICGSSRVAIYGITSRFVVNTLGDWHQDVAHAAKSVPAAQELITRSNRETFNATMLDLANKLDVDNGQGGTYLDDCLLAWGQESGFPSHDYSSTPVVTIGGAAGAFNTGLYCDYRNKTPGYRREVEFINNVPVYEYAGILHSQWLASALRAMGVPKSDWPNVSADNAGYGDARVGFGYGRTIIDNSWKKGSECCGSITDANLTKMIEFANQPLPFIEKV